VYCNRSSLGFLFVCWVCYHDNSKLRAPILTKKGLQVKVVTISNWLNIGRPARPGRGSAAGRIFFSSASLQPACSVCVSLSAYSHLLCHRIRSTNTIIEHRTQNTKMKKKTLGETQTLRTGWLTHSLNRKTKHTRIVKRRAKHTVLGEGNNLLLKVVENSKYWIRRDDATSSSRCRMIDKARNTTSNRRTGP